MLPDGPTNVCALTPVIALCWLYVVSPWGVSCCLVLLVVLCAVVPGVGLLDVSVVTVASPTSTTPSLTARVSTPPSPTTPISDERMGCWGALAPPFPQEILRSLNQVDDFITVKNLFPT